MVRNHEFENWSGVSNLSGGASSGFPLKSVYGSLYCWFEQFHSWFCSWGTCSTSTWSASSVISHKFNSLRGGSLWFLYYFSPWCKLLPRAEGGGGVYIRSQNHSHEQRKAFDFFSWYKVSKSWVRWFTFTDKKINKH